MALYYYVIDAAAYRGSICPALGEAWRRRSFAPARALCAELLPALAAFRERYRLGGDEFLVERAADHLPFDRETWRCLAGEVLLLAAAELPEIDDARDGLRRLLASELPEPRPERRRDLHPVEQVYRGSDDVLFGTAFYRPEYAGVNGVEDVARLADYLEGIDAAAWSPEALADIPDADDRADELEYLRQSLAAVRDLYTRARAASHLIVCEALG